MMIEITLSISCVIIPSAISQPSLANIIDESDPFILYVVGEYQHIYMYMYVDYYAI